MVQWPRHAEARGRYLVVADVELGEPGEWPYAREEFVIGCVLEGGTAFRVEAMGSTGLVLHRFGGPTARYGSWCTPNGTPAPTAPTACA
ncbi:hypothetical protein [Dactylosporangium cerinum]